MELKPIKHGIFLVLTSFLLVGCIHRGPKAEKGEFHCYFRNSTTEKLFLGSDVYKFLALRQARQQCRLGPVPWNCKFRHCYETWALATNK